LLAVINRPQVLIKGVLDPINLFAVCLVLL